MKALSIRQPWAFLVLTGQKDIENRTYRLPPYMEGQRVIVHAGKTRDTDFLAWHEELGISLFDALLLTSTSIPTGALLGEVTLTGCVTESDSIWFAGEPNYGWQLAAAAPYRVPVPYAGRLGFFDVPDAEAHPATGDEGGKGDETE